MTLLTPVNIRKSDRPIGYENKILLLGSCFTEHISQKMQSAYLPETHNPFGILYNPASIAHFINVMLQKEELPQYVQYGGLWHSWFHHGSFSAANKSEFEQKINQSLIEGKRTLQAADTIIITFGTAWVYEYDEIVVANCHKLPANQFQRRRLSVEEIVNQYNSIFSLPQMQNKRFIFTVSPIRHLKDGLRENQISKATLHLAIEQLEKMPNVEYFPAYEILIDELRDYRFYGEDMVHPSTVAIDYIWQKFCDTYFSTSTLDLIAKAHKLQLRRQHKLLHPDADDAQKFQEGTLKLAQELRRLGISC